jgi:hypothetical protein
MMIREGRGPIESTQPSPHKNIFNKKISKIEKEIYKNNCRPRAAQKKKKKQAMDIYNRGRGCFYLIRACWKAQAKKSRGQPRAIN